MAVLGKSRNVHVQKPLGSRAGQLSWPELPVAGVRIAVQGKERPPSGPDRSKAPGARESSRPSPASAAGLRNHRKSIPCCDSSCLWERVGHTEGCKWRVCHQVSRIPLPGGGASAPWQQRGDRPLLGSVLSLTPRSCRSPLTPAAFSCVVECVCLSVCERDRDRELPGTAPN